MQVVEICRMYGWTYEQYFDQPVPFLALIKEKMSIDAKKADQEATKYKS